MNFTPFGRLLLSGRGRRVDKWRGHSAEIQLGVLRRLLSKGQTTEFGVAHDFADVLRDPDVRGAFTDHVKAEGYEAFRGQVMRMTDGEADILWPGTCNNFAQSSGTSGGRSKFIPITRDSLRFNHYPGSADVVAQYLRHFPESRLLAGKALILGGSFESRLHPKGHNVKVGDLSATLIDSMPGPSARFRVPDKKIALMADWEKKLDALARASIGEDITNLSGVPSWFLRVIKHALEISGREKASDLWPNLEVFFHGGISFDPYREEYERLTDPSRMHFFETYNASEGFFATQASRENDGLLLLIDNGIFYEFLPLEADPAGPTLGVDEVVPGEVYEMIITSCNGLWRYRIGDTVKVVSVDPLKIRVAGRTKAFINAFGEELMESNAEEAVAAACFATGAEIVNYTAGPLYASEGHKGRHQWVFEWSVPPSDPDLFGRTLDDALCESNSDYAAKRAGSLFLDPPEIFGVPLGTFDLWLSHQGSGKLGGQRKIPRLRNDRSILTTLLRHAGPISREYPQS